MTFVVGGFAYDGEEVVFSLRAIFRELGQVHPHQRESCVRSGLLREIESPYDRIHQIRLGGVLGSFEQLLAVYDLDHAALGRSVAGIYAVALGTGGNGAVNVAGLEAGRE